MTNEDKSALQAEIISTLDYRPHGRAILAPRVGKSKIVIDLIKRDSPVSILWVTPSAKLAKEDIPQEFDTWKASEFKEKLITSTWRSLDKVMGFFDLVIFDEEQHATKNNLVNFFNGSLGYGNIFSMTGTETKDKEKQELYNMLNLKTLYTLSIQAAVNKKVLSDYEINVILVPLSEEKDYPGGSKKKPFKTSEKAQYKYLNKVAEAALDIRHKTATFKVRNRTNFIKNCPTKTKAAKYLLSTIKGRKLIFAGSIAQSQELCKHTYNSKTDDNDLNAFKEGKIDSIAMVQSGGTGYTYKKIDHLVIVQADSDKNGGTSQKITRTLLAQEDYSAKIWIICLRGTKDSVWVKSTLENFDKTKTKIIEWNRTN